MRSRYSSSTWRLIGAAVFGINPSTPGKLERVLHRRSCRKLLAVLWKTPPSSTPARSSKFTTWVKSRSMPSKPSVATFILVNISSYLVFLPKIPSGLYCRSRVSLVMLDCKGERSLACSLIRTDLNVDDFYFCLVPDF